MLVRINKGNVFASPARHILFAVNSEGINDGGFAGQVAQRAWIDLATIGPCTLGTLLTYTHRERYYHAAVLHSLGAPGWTHACDHLRAALSFLNDGSPERTPAPDEAIAAVRMGAGLIGQMAGAPADDLLNELAASKLRFEVWGL